METQKNVVISCSKDTFVKFWDLRTHHCFKTLTGHLAEVWDMELIRGEEMLITGGMDSELRVWSLKWSEDDDDVKTESSAKRKPVVPGNTENDEADENTKNNNDEEDGSNLTVTRVGSILRKGEGRVGSLRVDKSGRMIVCHGNDRVLEMFVICTQEEIEKRLAKRLKKEKKRAGEGEEVTGEATLPEMIRRVKEVRVGGKLRSAAVLVTSTTEVRCLVVLSNNLVEIVKCDLSR